jgi:hypothetical protein
LKKEKGIARLTGHFRSVREAPEKSFSIGHGPLLGYSDGVVRLLGGVVLEQLRSAAERVRFAGLLAALTGLLGRIAGLLDPLARSFARLVGLLATDGAEQPAWSPE